MPDALVLAADVGAGEVVEGEAGELGGDGAGELTGCLSAAGAQGVAESQTEGEATCPGQHLGIGAPIGRELEGLPHAYSVSLAAE